jgi:hypothetical protein
VLVPDAKRITSFLLLLKKESMERCGLELNFSKGFVVPGKEQAWPVGAVLPPGTVVKTDGIRLAGAPLGTDAFCKAYVEDEVSEMVSKLHRLKGLARHEKGPQVGLRILQQCLSRAATFLLQVTPPMHTLAAARRLDDAMFTAAMELNTDTELGAAPEASAHRNEAARHIFFAPCSQRGMGIGSAERAAPLAWYASVAACQFHDEELLAHRGGLERFGAHAHAEVLQSTLGQADWRGVLSRADKAEKDGASVPVTVREVAIRKTLAVFEAANPSSLTAGTFCVDIYNTNPSVKLQSALTSAANELANHEHMLEFSKVDTLKDITKSDVVATFTRTQRSRIFRAPLTFRANRWDAAPFARYFRFFLRIPQQPHLGNLQQRQELPFQYETESCCQAHPRGQAKSSLDRALDLHGNHACSSCPSTAKGRYCKHTALNNGIVYMLKKAHCSVSKEPRTHDVLEGKYSPRECRLLFRKSPTIAHKAKVDELVAQLRRANSGLVSPDEKASILKKVDEEVAIMARIEKKKTGAEPSEEDRQGLRLDAAATDTYSGKRYWMDATSPHPTCKSCIDAELKSTMQNVEAFLQGKKEKDWPCLEGARAAKAEKDKRLLYTQLAMIGQKQAADSGRKHAPKFMPLVVTTLGELGTDMIRMQEIATSAYAQRLMQERETQGREREDGRTIASLTAEYRTEFRTRPQVDVAKGVARMLGDAGIPIRM